MPRKKQVKKASIEETTAALLAELGPKEKKEPEKKPVRRKRKPKAGPPPIKETKAVREYRGRVLKLVEAVWKEPSKVKHNNIPGYIRGLVTFERNNKDRDVDHELVHDLLFLAELWRVKIGEG